MCGEPQLVTSRSHPLGHNDKLRFGLRGTRKLPCRAPGTSTSPLSASEHPRLHSDADANLTRALASCQPAVL